MAETRIALVTGGAQGIGRGIAERFLKEGMAVVVGDCDAEACAEAAEALSAMGTAYVVTADVSREEDVRHLIAECLSRFGRLDALVNNAGIAKASGGSVETLALEDWHRVISVNLTGPFLCSKHAAPALRRARGAIVNIASTRALMSEANTEAYSASKGGLLALTHALAVSLGPEVRVNVISPGWIDVSEWKKSSRRRPPELRSEDHAQHPAGRVGAPEDIAALAWFLVSPEAGFITGANMIADGGMTRKMIYIE